MSAEHPNALIHRLLRDRFGVVDRELNARIRAELEGEADYLVCALLELCRFLLDNDDTMIEEWRTKRRSEKRWPIEKVWLAASLVADVRALGYVKEKACWIVQEQKYPPRPYKRSRPTNTKKKQSEEPETKQKKFKSALQRMLEREAKAGTFDGLTLTRRSRKEAREALSKHGIEIEHDGNLEQRPVGEVLPWWGEEVCNVCGERAEDQKYELDANGVRWCQKCLAAERRDQAR